MPRKFHQVQVSKRLAKYSTKVHVVFSSCEYWDLECADENECRTNCVFHILIRKLHETINQTQQLFHSYISIQGVNGFWGFVVPLHSTSCLPYSDSAGRRIYPSHFLFLQKGNYTRTSNYWPVYAISTVTHFLFILVDKFWSWSQLMECNQMDKYYLLFLQKTIKVYKRLEHYEQ